MSEKEASGWRELQRAQQSSCPKLFYNFKINTDTFVLHLTDLVAIWQCSSSKADILKLAKDRHTSIDPSESTSQLQILLQKLSQSLRMNRNILWHDKDEGKQVVHLTTESELPKPLKPLIWTFELQPQPACELAEHLLRPCLFEASVSQQKIESLQRVIKDKDHVLSRLLEKIESSSTDLSLIFPGITGFRPKRGRLTVTDAEKHIKGMRKFDQEEWLTYFNTDNPYAGYDQKGINNLVVGCEKCPKHTAEEHADWLKSLPKIDDSLGGVSVESVKASFTSSGGTDLGNEDDTASEDDFERQPTPPSARKRKNTQKHHDVKSGASESDEDSPPPAKKVNNRRLGGLAKSKEEAPPRGTGTNLHSPKSHCGGRNSPPKDIRRPKNPRLRNSSADDKRLDSASPTLSSTESEDDLDSTRSKPILKNKSLHADHEDDLFSAGIKQTRLNREKHHDKVDIQVRATQVKNKAGTEKSKLPSRSASPESRPSTPSRRLGKLGHRGKDIKSSPASSPPISDKKATSERGGTLDPNTGPNITTVGHTTRKNRTAMSDDTDDGGEEDLDAIREVSTRSKSIKDHQSKSPTSKSSQFRNNKSNDSPNIKSPSATPTPTPSPSPKETRNRNTMISPSKFPIKPPRHSLSPSPAPPPTLNRTETAEEKANRRREELKRKTEGVGVGGGGGGGSGVRKKRKF